jgi:hypothetical protein
MHKKTQANRGFSGSIFSDSSRLTARQEAELAAQRPAAARYEPLPADPQRRKPTPGQWWALFFDEFTEEGKRARAAREAAAARGEGAQGGTS